MRRTIQRYLWLIHIGGILLTSLFIAIGSNAIFAAFITERIPYPPIEEHPKKQKELVLQDDLGPAQKRNLFNRAMYEPVDEPPPVDGSQNPSAEDLKNEAQEALIEKAAADGMPIPTKLRIILVGTQVASDPSWSIGIIQSFAEGSSEETLYVRRGQTFLDDAKVLQVVRDRVYFQRLSEENRIEYIDIETDRQEIVARAVKKIPSKKESRTNPSKTSKESAPIEKPSSSRSRPVASASGIDINRIEESGRNSYVVPKDMADSFRNNQKLLRDPKFGPPPKLSPYYQNKRIAGFRLLGLQNGTLYHKLGLRNGDTILTVNGQLVDKPQKAIAIFDNLSNNAEVKVRVNRRGRIETLNYQLQ